MEIPIKNAKGSTRRGRAPDGTEWSVEMPAHYGYVRRTEGADGDQVDVYVGDAPESDRVFVIDQYDPETGEFDEHKAVLGTVDPDDALAIYDAGFSDGSGPRRRGDVTELTIDEFKRWAREGDTSRPLFEQQEAVADEERQPTAAAEDGERRPAGEEPAPAAGQEQPQAPTAEQGGADVGLVDLPADWNTSLVRARRAAKAVGLTKAEAGDAWSDLRALTRLVNERRGVDAEPEPEAPTDAAERDDDAAGIPPRDDRDGEAGPGTPEEPAPAPAEAEPRPEEGRVEGTPPAPAAEPSTETADPPLPAGLALTSIEQLSPEAADREGYPGEPFSERVVYKR